LRNVTDNDSATGWRLSAGWSIEFSSFARNAQRRDANRPILPKVLSWRLSSAEAGTCDNPFLKLIFPESGVLSDYDAGLSNQAPDLSASERSGCHQGASLNVSEPGLDIYAFDFESR